VNLEKALKEFKRGRYSVVINTLEPQVLIYNENYKFFYILGMSSFFTGDWGGAYAYLKKADRLNSNNLFIKLAFAAVALKRGLIKKSLDTYLQILETEPGNRYALKGLNKIKSMENPEVESAGLKESDIYKLVPEKKRKKTASRVNTVFGVVTALLICVLAGSALGYYRFKENSDSLTQRAVPFSGDKIKVFSDFSADSEKVFSDDEIRKYYNLSVRYFSQQKDNLARIEFNRLLHANISEEVRNRIKSMISLIPEPDFSVEITNIDYDLIFDKKEPLTPYLYDKIYVKWKGRIANVDVDDDEIRFKFLVGYHDKKIIKGTVGASIAFSENLDVNFSYELLARIDVVSDKEIKLKVLALHKLLN
jgi:tetratricopeptide (TPR) repeat protein